MDGGNRFENRIERTAKYPELLACYQGKRALISQPFNIVPGCLMEVKAVVEFFKELYGSFSVIRFTDITGMLLESLLIEWICGIKFL